MNKKDPREKWVTIIPLLGIFVGLSTSGILIWDGLRSVVNHEYCKIMEDSFGNGLDSQIWTKEVEVGGFGQVLMNSLRSPSADKVAELR